MGILENSEDPDEMPHNAAFHQGLHCLLRQNRSSEKEMQYYYALTLENMEYFNGLFTYTTLLRGLYTIMNFDLESIRVYSTFANLCTNYLMMCKVYTDVGGIK